VLFTRCLRLARHADPNTRRGVVTHDSSRVRVAFDRPSLGPGVQIVRRRDQVLAHHDEGRPDAALAPPADGVQRHAESLGDLGNGQQGLGWLGIWVGVGHAASEFVEEPRRDVGGTECVVEMVRIERQDQPARFVWSAQPGSVLSVDSSSGLEQSSQAGVSAVAVRTARPRM
jgi:hypothetical protein